MLGVLAVIAALGFAAWILTRLRVKEEVVEVVKTVEEEAKEALEKPPLVAEVAPEVPPVVEPPPVYVEPEPAVEAVKAALAEPSAAEKLMAEAKERELREWGVTEAEIPALRELALQVNRELGGSYVAGVLTPPASWTGTVTEWSRHVREVAVARYHRTIEVAKEAELKIAKPPPEPEPVPAPPPAYYTCPYCGKGFVSKMELAIHIGMRH